MVTLLTPVKRVLSRRARTKVDSPGLRKGGATEALTQPQDTRRPEMLTGPPVLLTTRKGWVSVGPRGTDPKSLESSSNSASAQVAAGAVPAAQRLARRTRLYRDMLGCSCWPGPGPPARSAAEGERAAGPRK